MVCKDFVDSCVGFTLVRISNRFGSKENYFQILVFEMSKSLLIGKKASFFRKGLKPNKLYKLELELTDTLGKKFQNSREFEANIDGELNIGENQFQSVIAAASSGLLKKLLKLTVSISKIRFKICLPFCKFLFEEIFESLIRCTCCFCFKRIS